MVRELIGGRQTADETAARSEARRDLHEDGGEQGGGRQTMAETTVEIPDHTNSESAKRVCYLGVRREALGREMVDDVPGKGDDEHDRDLLVATMVDDNQTERKGRHEDEFEPDRHGRRASSVVGRLLIDGTKNRGADRNAKAKKQGVYHGVDHTNGAGDYVTGLKLKRAAKDGVAR